MSQRLWALRAKVVGGGCRSRPGGGPCSDEWTPSLTRRRPQAESLPGGGSRLRGKGSRVSEVRVHHPRSPLSAPQPNERGAAATPTERTGTWSAPQPNRVDTKQRYWAVLAVVRSVGVGLVPTSFGWGAEHVAGRGLRPDALHARSSRPPNWRAGDSRTRLSSMISWALLCVSAESVEIRPLGTVEA